MACKVGIPRALLYYRFSRLWPVFFEKIGYEVKISDETNKATIDRGAASVVDEVCLPVKIFFGHLDWLSDCAVDYLFVPRIVSIEKKAYICPKVMGLPDMAAAAKKDYPPLISPLINNIGGEKDEEYIRELSPYFSCGKKRLKQAWLEAKKEQTRYDHTISKELWIKEGLKDNDSEVLNVLVLSHCYVAHDRYLNMNLLEKLNEARCRVILPENISDEFLEREVRGLKKRPFWTYGKQLLGSAFWFSRMPGRKGAIILTTFGCGIDSFIGNMAERHFKKAGIPYLIITLDEHTGQAGLETRVEAFLDMLRWRRKHYENNFPPYGEYLDTATRDAGIHRAYSCCTSYDK